MVCIGGWLRFVLGVVCLGVSFGFPIFNVVLVVLILDVGLMGWTFCCVARLGLG